MKQKIILLCLALAALGVRVDAQKFEFGVRLMPIFSSFGLQTSTGNTVKGDVKLGFGGGAFMGYNFSRHVGGQVEVLYSTIAQQYQEEDVVRKVNLRYVHVPLLLSLNTGKSNWFNFNIVAGPQLGINAGSRLTTSAGEGTDNRHAILALKRNDIGFAYGAGVDFGLNPSRRARVSAGYRGVLGLLNIRDKSAAIDPDSYYILDRERINTNAAYVGLSIMF
jgi:hypothetical protein